MNERQGISIAVLTAGQDDVELVNSTLRDAGHAAQMIRCFADAHHEVITGVAMLVYEPGGQGNSIEGNDKATVRFGAIPDRVIDAYVSTGAWQGTRRR